MNRIKRLLLALWLLLSVVAAPLAASPNPAHADAYWEGASHPADAYWEAANRPLDGVGDSPLVP